MNSPFKHKVITLYCIVFYLLMVYKLLNGMLLFQLKPSFFYIRQDVFTWLFMQTGWHQWLLNNPAGWITADALFYLMPAVYFFCYLKKPKAAATAAGLMLLANWVYVQCYTLYASNSIEGHVPWLLFPFPFLFNRPVIFSLMWEGLRYFFLFLFSSAAVWKIVQGGIFNVAEMSGILLYQHNQMLTNSPNYWLSEFYMWLIQGPALSYFLYLSAFLAELSFCIGFFTKKYDRLLAVIFVFFLLMDHLIMRIPYYELCPFLLTLLIKDKEPDKSVA